MRSGITALVLTAGLVAGLAASSAGFSLTFDENGHGRLTNNGVVSQVAGYMQLDPTGGVAGNILTYDLPEYIVAGDIAFYEPGQPEYTSDIFRFYDDAVGGHLIFYSGFGDSDLADTSGLPYDFVFQAPAGTLVLPEVGPEGGVQWCIYEIPNNNSYYGLSDTPSPGAFIPFAVGLIAVLKRRMKA